MPETNNKNQTPENSDVEENRGLPSDSFNKINLKWILLGIAAIALMWFLSSLLYK